MTDLPSWDEIAERQRDSDARAHEQALLLYRTMVDYWEREAARTGARLQIMEPGRVLPTQAGEAPLAMRMDAGSKRRIVLSTWSRSFSAWRS